MSFYDGSRNDHGTGVIKRLDYVSRLVHGLSLDQTLSHDQCLSHNSEFELSVEP